MKKADECTYRENLIIPCPECGSTDTSNTEMFFEDHNNKWINITIECNKCRYGFSLQLTINKP